MTPATKLNAAESLAYELESNGGNLDVMNPGSRPQRGSRRWRCVGRVFFGMGRRSIHRERSTSGAKQFFRKLDADVGACRCSLEMQTTTLCSCSQPLPRVGKATIIPASRQTRPSFTFNPSCDRCATVSSSEAAVQDVKNVTREPEVSTAAPVIVEHTPSPLGEGKRPSELSKERKHLLRKSKSGAPRFALE